MVLGVPATVLGAIDGVAEATEFRQTCIGPALGPERQAKAVGRRRLRPAALSKPLFPLAGSAGMVMLARFTDRIAKGIRGAPRDAMADETPPAIRGRAFGLRQSLDTVGALVAPIAAVGLRALFASDVRMVFWIAVIPAFGAFLLAGSRFESRSSISSRRRHLPSSPASATSTRRPSGCWASASCSGLRASPKRS